MTAPILDPSYTEQSQDQRDFSPAEEAIIAVLVAWLATSVAVGAVSLPIDVIRRLVDAGMEARAAAAAGRIALSAPVLGVTRRRVGGSTAADRVARDELSLRARYIVNAARRLSVALRGGVAPVAAYRNERRHFEASRSAARRRNAAARALDAAARVSPWLEWRSVLDDRTTADCRAMHGRIFTLDNPPKIGLPGMVHPRCRCKGLPYGVADFGAIIPIRAAPIAQLIGV